MGHDHALRAPDHAPAGGVVKAAALCAGYGGLEMGLALAGVEVDLNWYAEIDKAPSAVMAHHHPDVPNLGDLTLITDPPEVDIVTAGFPCQPVSTAGKRKGIHDERWLIDDVCRVASRAGARWLVLENVAGVITANRGEAFYQILRALASYGFAAEWVCVRASDVGAPHNRLRWFCLAYADESGGEARLNARHDSERLREEPVGSATPAPHASVVGRQTWTRPGESQQGGILGHGPDDDSRATTPDADGSPGEDGERKVWLPDSARRDEVAPDADLPGRGEHRRAVAVQPSRPAAEHAGDHLSRFGPYADAIARWEPVVGRPAPSPTDDKRRLNPAFVEWMMGLPAGWVTEPLTARSKALKVLGNGVVPQQAVAAITLLAGQVAS